MKHERHRDVLYSNRRLSDGYPDLERLGVEWFEAQLSGTDRTWFVDRLVGRLSRLMDVTPPRRIAVVGCGPNPQTVRRLRELGHDAVGVEPVAGSVEAAVEYLGSPEAVRSGAAEELPFEAGEVDLVLAESVLEHVDSVPRSLAEMHRVLRPGGIAWIGTTNRLRPYPPWKEAEFNVPFFHWLPGILRESYVFFHLHFDPSLANYTPRPAVHWFSFADLCRLGRDAGFAHFYSVLDLIDPGEFQGLTAPLMRRIIAAARSHPVLRTLMLLQYGGTIAMRRRG
ncbi:MAG: class I SAM-dependent methyltransferase [Deltaproteobacteria bacterium]|nr:class I SAM-dependent methyltransferase [Deltaproteobacteria bacterium]